MPYVDRDARNRVVGKFYMQQYKNQEFLPDEHPDLVFRETPEEIAQKQEAKIDALDRLIFELEFNQENRLRVLEGKSEISKSQYRDALISVYRTLNV
jgi:hypothetical protein